MFQPTIDLESLWTTLPAQLKMPLLILPVLRKFYQQNKQSDFRYIADMVFNLEIISQIFFIGAKKLE